MERAWRHGLGRRQKESSAHRALNEARSVAELVASTLSCVYQATRTARQPRERPRGPSPQAIGAEVSSSESRAGQDMWRLAPARSVASWIGRPTTWPAEHPSRTRRRASAVANVRGAPNALDRQSQAEGRVGYRPGRRYVRQHQPEAGIDKAFLRQWLGWMEERGSRTGCAIRLGRGESRADRRAAPRASSPTKTI